MRRHSISGLASLNLLMLVASLILGAILYHGAFGYADALNMYNPAPQLDAASGTTRVASGLPGYVRDWYCGLNGRWGQALMNGSIQMLSRSLVHRPETFPWWLMRSLSLFCLIATPVNFLRGTRQFGSPHRAQGAVLLALAWMIWSAANNTYGYSLWFDVLLTDRFVPMYLASVLAVLVGTGWPARRAAPLLAFSALYLLIAVEQFLVTLPIVIGLYGALAAGRRGWRRLEPFALAAVLSGVSAVIYAASPGQQWRNRLLQLQAPDLSPHGLFTWFKTAMPLGYRVLLGPGDAIYWKVHLLLLLGSLVLLAAGGAALVRRRASWTAGSPRLVEALTVLAAALAFQVAYACSLATLLVSPHFPEYAAQYPALLLTLALVLTTGAAFRLADPTIWTTGAGAVDDASAVDRTTVLLVGACLVAVLVTITFPALTADAASFREEARFGALRKRVYRRVLDLNARTGATGFILTNSPLRSIGGNMEPPWGLSAYFRWIHRQDLAVVIDTNYDFSTRPQDREYVTVDVSRFW
jgi:hypothetical protein